MSLSLPSHPLAPAPKLRGVMSNERTRAIGERIRECRERLDLTQEELARRTESVTITGNVVSRWERGRNRPSSDSLEQLATALGVPASYLTFGNVAPQSSPADTETLERMEAHLAGIDAKLGQLVSLLGDDEHGLGALVQQTLAGLDGEALPRSAPAAQRRKSRATQPPASRKRANG